MQLKDELFFSTQTRAIVRCLRPVITLLNFILRPQCKYSGLIYGDFGNLEENMDKASKFLGINLNRMGLYQLIDTLFRFSEYLPLVTEFRVFPPPGSIYQAETSFFLESAPPNLELIYEDLGEPVTVKINGKDVDSKPRPERVWDDSNQALDIGGHLHSGKNHLVFTSRQPSFPSLYPSYHTLEPMVLRGGFEVKEKNRLSFKPSATKPGGDLNELGYPHYLGKVKYALDVELEEKHLDYYLLLDCGEIGDQVDAVVNGKPAGRRIGPPFQFAIRDFAQAGKNRIELIVSNTAANLLAQPVEWGLKGAVTIWPFYCFSRTRAELSGDSL